MKKLLWMFVVICCLLGGIFLTSMRKNQKKKQWQQDFRQLVQYTLDSYANLDYIVKKRNINLQIHIKKHRQKLQQARSFSEHYDVLAGFIHRFQDMHFRLETHKYKWREWIRSYQHKKKRKLLKLDSLNPSEACDALGIKGKSKDFRLPLSSFPNFTQLSKGIGFHSLIWQKNPQQKVGFLRIPLFANRAYRKLCEHSWKLWSKKQTKNNCKQHCQQMFLWKFLPDQILKDFEKKLRQLKRQNIQSLVIDITRNGGGTDWVDPMARMLTTKNLQCPRFHVIKGKHWRKQLQATKKRLLKEQKKLAPAFFRKQLLRIKQHITNIDNKCRRTLHNQQTCSNLLNEPLSSCGLLFSPQKEATTSKLPSFIFRPHFFQYTKGIFSKKLFVLVDRYTASASEYFVAILQDHHAATIIGEKTLGVGCGYTNGGNSVTLRHSKLKVIAPDCSRIRKNGQNEIDGITPNLVLPWHKHDSQHKKAQKLLNVLKKQ